MTTMDSPGFLELMLAKGARAANRRRYAKETRVRVSNAMQVTIRLALHLAGFTCLTVAGFGFNFLAGMIVAGASCFVLSTLLTTSTKTNENPDPSMRR
jgi:hypothetical protein